MGLFIVYFKGSQVFFPNHNIFPTLRIVFTLTNSVDPDEMLHYAAFHLGLHCLSMCPYTMVNLINVFIHAYHKIKMLIQILQYGYISQTDIALVGNFSCFCCCLLTFFKINFFKKLFQEHFQSVKWFGSRSGPTFCRSRSGSKLLTKIISRRQVATSKEKVNYTVRISVLIEGPSILT